MPVSLHCLELTGTLQDFAARLFNKLQGKIKKSTDPRGFTHKCKRYLRALANLLL